MAVLSLWGTACRVAGAGGRRSYGVVTLLSCYYRGLVVCQWRLQRVLMILFGVQLSYAWWFCRVPLAFGAVVLR